MIPLKEKMRVGEMMPAEGSFSAGGGVG